MEWHRYILFELWSLTVSVHCTKLLMQRPLKPLVNFFSLILSLNLLWQPPLKL